MNKDEMIKDLRAIIDARCEAELGQVHAESKGGKVTKTVSTSLIAKDIYNADYRKVADDEIVIKKSEYEELKTHIEELQTKLGAVMLCIKNTHEIDISDLLRTQEQETAREILQELKNRQTFMLADEVFGRETVVTQTINKLAKKYGIELED